MNSEGNDGERKDRLSEEELARRRREKVLSRAKDFNEDQEPDQPDYHPSDQSSAFQRYQSIKGRIRIQEKLAQSSKAVGLAIYVLTFLFPSEAVFAAALAVLLMMAFQYSSSGGSKQKKEPFLPGAIGHVLSNIHHLDRLLFLLRISLNVLMSYLVAAVLLSSLLSQIASYSDNEVPQFEL